MTHILVIDDEATYLKMIAQALEPTHWQIHTADNGVHGLAMAKTFKPDLIVTDVVMPDINGYEVSRQLRRDPEFAHTPIMVLTAQSGLQDKLQSFEAGADDHLTKPFEPAELVARLTVLLRHAEEARSVGPAPIAKEVRSIAVHSLRGGTGASSLAVNLAVGFASLWKTQTILLDLSMVAGQVALMLNASLRRTWADLASFEPGELDPEVIDSIIYKHESGLSFIASPTFPSETETIKNETLAAALQLLWRRFDYIVADLSHDFSAITIQALDVADLVLMVASPDMSSIRAAAAAMDTYSKLNYPPDKIKLVLNATFPRSGLPKEKIETALKIPVTVTIPYTQELFVEAINLGRPLVSEKPDEPVSGLLEDLAFHLSKEADKKSKPKYPSEAWKRVYQRYTKKRKQSYKNQHIL
jgi:pilus assembly protein CpaE